MSSGPQCIWPARAVLGEGPCWHEESRSLLWLDIKGRRLFRYFEDTGEKREYALPLMVGSVAVPPDGWSVKRNEAALTLLAGTEKGFAWLILRKHEVELEIIADPESHLPGNRFNDGKIGPDGRFYAGTMDNEENLATGALYALNPKFEVMQLDAGYRVTNGPAFSPDGRIVYHNDSARQIIYRFVLATDGSLRDREIFHRFSEGEGYPDGMTTDRYGNLYVAMWDGWRIEIFDPNGQRRKPIQFPVARVTSCTFAGKNEHLLFVTTAATGTHPEEQPLAGGLFRLVL